MNSLRLISLYSGSSGNAFLIVTPWGNLLIDAGRNAKKLCASLADAGVDADSVSAIFLTHEHTDHTGALPVFLKRHPIPLYLPNGCAAKFSTEEQMLPCLRPHPPIWEDCIGRIKVRSFPTPHDAKASCGYRFEIPAEDGTVFSFGYATDIGYVSEDVRAGLLGCRAVVLESNHDPEMLASGTYPEELKVRIASKKGHLSNPDSACFASELVENGTKYLLLAHLSEENNRPELAYDECFSQIGEAAEILIACRDEITEMNREGRGWFN